MRISEFQTLAREEFGRALGDTLVIDLVLPVLDVTAAQALQEGTDPRAVWLALCKAMDVPPERWFGRERNRSAHRD